MYTPTAQGSLPLQRSTNTGALSGEGRSGLGALMPSACGCGGEVGEVVAQRRVGKTPFSAANAQRAESITR